VKTISAPDIENHKKIKQEFFDTSHLQKDLKYYTVRGGIATLGAQGLGSLLAIGSIAILARLLTPADFGLVAMVTSLIGILTILKDAGLTMVTVQQDKITHEQVSTLFWINVALSLLITLAIASLAPVIVWFYDEPNLFPITIAVACLFIFDGLAVQHQALLRRQMHFETLARIQVISSSFAVFAAIAAALIGSGYWALLVQSATSQLISLALTWRYCRWIPGWPRYDVGIRPLLKFGGYLTGFSFINYFARNADNVLIGKAWGSSELALYSKAYSLLLFPLQQVNGPISAVAIPALSRLQNDPERFREFFRNVLGIVAFITFPIIAWMIVCRREIVLLVLGPQWEGAIPIFGIFAISAFFQPIGNITGVLYIALGRTKRMFRWGVMSTSWILLSFIVGVYWGAIGVALAYSIAIIVMIIPLILYAISGTHVRLMDVYIAIKYPSLFCFISVLIAFFSQFFLLSDGVFLLKLGWITVTMFSLYISMVYTFQRRLILQTLQIYFKK